MITPQQERIERFIVWVVLFYFVAAIGLWLRSLWAVSPAPEPHPAQIVAPAQPQAITNALFIQDSELAAPGQYAADHQSELAKGDR